MITLKEIHERDKRPPSVTVSMTCYNHAKYIDEAIRGVLMQKTNFPVNIVIHDDASPDGCGDIIRRYAAENPNITPIIEERNCFQNGISFFPKVLPHLTGKYIAYCECDDFWIDEHKLQIQVDYLEANPDCVAVYSNTMPVNKYSEYDESSRTGINLKTGEGDYPPEKLFGVEHQLASCVIRNFWRFASPDDIDFYVHVKGPGDQKMLALFLRLGRVHYFSQEFAAYRHITDEGGSWSAKLAKMGEYDMLKERLQWRAEVYRMIEHFFGEKHYWKYIYFLWIDFTERRLRHRSIIKDIPLHDCYQYRNIPWFIYLWFAGYVSYRAAKKIAKVILKPILPEKLRAWLRSFRRRKDPFTSL